MYKQKKTMAKYGHFRKIHKSYQPQNKRDIKDNNSNKKIEYKKKIEP